MATTATSARGASAAPRHTRTKSTMDEALSRERLVQLRRILTTPTATARQSAVGHINKAMDRLSELAEQGEIKEGVYVELAKTLKDAVSWIPAAFGDSNADTVAAPSVDATAGTAGHFLGAVLSTLKTAYNVVAHDDSWKMKVFYKKDYGLCLNCWDTSGETPERLWEIKGNANCGSFPKLFEYEDNKVKKMHWGEGDENLISYFEHGLTDYTTEYEEVLDTSYRVVALRYYKGSSVSDEALVMLKDLAENSTYEYSGTKDHEQLEKVTNLTTGAVDFFKRIGDNDRRYRRLLVNGQDEYFDTTLDSEHPFYIMNYCGFENRVAYVDPQDGTLLSFADKNVSVQWASDGCCVITWRSKYTFHASSEEAIVAFSTLEDGLMACSTVGKPYGWDSAIRIEHYDWSDADEIEAKVRDMINTADLVAHKVVRLFGKRKRDS